MLLQTQGEQIRMHRGFALASIGFEALMRPQEVEVENGLAQKVEAVFEFQVPKLVGPSPRIEGHEG